MGIGLKREGAFPISHPAIPEYESPGRTKIFLFSNQKSIFRSPIDPVFSFVQSIEKRKIARLADQAIFVDGVGRNLNERVVILSISHYPCAWAQGRTAIPMIIEQKPPLGAVSFEGITYFE